MFKFKVSECPPDRTVIAWIKENVGWKHWDADSETLLLPNVNFDADQGAKELQTLFERVTPVYWKSQKPGALYGLSLTYNPESDPSQWHHGSFGDAKYRALPPEQYFNAPEKDQPTATKNSYLDSLSFRKRLPQLQGLSTLENFLDGFNFPVVRATVRVIDGTKVYPTQADSGGMHRDSPSSEFLRINVCVTGNDSFGLEYDNGTLILDQPGQCVVVNTDRMHRAWVAKRSPVQRAHLVIDVAPWLTYHEEEDAWSVNDYFGKVHPFDMVRMGLIHRGT